MNADTSPKDPRLDLLDRNFAQMLVINEPDLKVPTVSLFTSIRSVNSIS